MTTVGSMRKSYRVLVIFGGDSSGASSQPDQRTRCCETHYTKPVISSGLGDPSETRPEDLHREDWDVAFPMLHGTNGEDGVIQRILQEIGLALDWLLSCQQHVDIR